MPMSVHADLELASVVTPVSALGAAEVNYAPTGISDSAVLRLTPAPEGSTISGLLAPTRGQLLLLVNVSPNLLDTITLLYEDATSLAANRVRFALGTDASLYQLATDAVRAVSPRELLSAGETAVAMDDHYSAELWSTDRVGLYTIPAEGTVWLWYDLTSARWRVVP